MHRSKLLLTLGLLASLVIGCRQSPISQQCCSNCSPTVQVCSKRTPLAARIWQNRVVTRKSTEHCCTVMELPASVSSEPPPCCGKATTAPIEPAPAKIGSPRSSATGANKDSDKLNMLPDIEPRKQRTKLSQRGKGLSINANFPDITKVRSDKSVNPSTAYYGNAKDYRWLSGVVEKGLTGMRLRYAPIDEVDFHGGSVTLMPASDLMDLEDGDAIRVEGRFYSTTPERYAPKYETTRVEVLSR